jgi:hypothetical protein
VPFPPGRYKIIVEGTTEKSNANWRGAFLVSFRCANAPQHIYLPSVTRLLGVFNVKQEFEKLWIMPAFPIEVSEVRLVNLETDTLTCYRFAAKSTNKQLLQLTFNPAAAKVPLLQAKE